MSDLHQDIKLETRETARLWRREVFCFRAWGRHALFVVAAVLTGLVAWYFQQAEVWGRDWFKFLQGEGGLFGSEWRMPGVLAVLVPMLVVTGSMLLIMQLRDRFFAGTEGTGIPQAIAALKTPEGPFRSMMLSWRIVIGKILLLTMGLFSGMTIGREGPSVHVGACLMYLITKITHYPAHLVRRGLILGGGGAGIAAAFNAPIAGIIFAFEEIGRSFEKNNAGTVIRTVILASLVVVLLLGKDYLFYGQVQIDASSWTLLQWSSVLFIGIIGGFLGGFFAQCVVKGTRVVGCCMKWNVWITPLVIGGSLALLGLVSGGETYGSGFPQAEAMLIPDADGNTWSAPWHYAPLEGMCLLLQPCQWDSRRIVRPQPVGWCRTWADVRSGHGCDSSRDCSRSRHHDVHGCLLCRSRAESAYMWSDHGRDDRGTLHDDPAAVDCCRSLRMFPPGLSNGHLRGPGRHLPRKCRAAWPITSKCELTGGEVSKPDVVVRFNTSAPCNYHRGTTRSSSRKTGADPASHPFHQRDGASYKSATAAFIDEDVSTGHSRKCMPVDDKFIKRRQSIFIPPFACCSIA